jgi:hypothetical protein
MLEELDSYRLLKIGKVAMQYYEQAPFQPSISDFTLWIDSLREPMKSDFNKMGMEKCKGILNFKRFILELNDYGMDAFMKTNLSSEDFALWQGNKNHIG